MSVWKSRRLFTMEEFGGITQSALQYDEGLGLVDGQNAVAVSQSIGDKLATKLLPGVMKS